SKYQKRLTAGLPKGWEHDGPCSERVTAIASRVEAVLRARHSIVMAAHSRRGRLEPSGACLGKNTSRPDADGAGFRKSGVRTRGLLVLGCFSGRGTGRSWYPARPVRPLLCCCGRNRDVCDFLCLLAHGIQLAQPRLRIRLAVGARRICHCAARRWPLFARSQARRRVVATKILSASPPKAVPGLPAYRNAQRRRSAAHSSPHSCRRRRPRSSLLRPLPWRPVHWSVTAPHAQPTEIHETGRRAASHSP